MANYIVLTCTTGGAKAAEVTPLGTSRGICPTANLAWTPIAENQPFDESQLTFQNVSLAWSAGFTCMATGLVVVMAGRALLRAFK